MRNTLATGKTRWVRTQPGLCGRTRRGSPSWPQLRSLSTSARACSARATCSAFSSWWRRRKAGSLRTLRLLLRRRSKSTTGCSLMTPCSCAERNSRRLHLLRFLLQRHCFLLLPSASQWSESCTYIRQSRVCKRTTRESRILLLSHVRFLARRSLKSPSSGRKSWWRPSSRSLWARKSYSCYHAGLPYQEDRERRQDREDGQMHQLLFIVQAHGLVWLFHEEIAHGRGEDRNSDVHLYIVFVCITSKVYFAHEKNNSQNPHSKKLRINGGTWILPFAGSELTSWLWIDSL